jgi:uncharacterized hydantoinase/oxoprolinase family protein
MLGADAPAETQDGTCWRELAAHIAGRQLDLVGQALADVIARLPGGPEPVIVGAGAGEFLARKLARRMQCRYVPVSELFTARGVGPRDISTCAPAVAVAELSRRSPLQ